MFGLNIRTLNRAEKMLLLIVCAALILVSGKPQVARAERINTQAFEPNQEIDNQHKISTTITIKKTTLVTATAYSSTIDQTDSTPFITSNGQVVYDGLIAANWLPYNTKIRIPDVFGEKVFTVNDRMNQRHDSGRIDIWMKNRDTAKQFGVKYIRIQIIE